MGDFDGSSKDQRSRRKANTCKDLVGQMVSMILDDNSYQNTRTWDGRMEIVRKAMDKLKDPRFMLQQLTLSPIIMENTSSSVDIIKALQVLESILKQSENAVMKQDWGNEIPELHPGSLPLEVQGTQPESHSSGKLKQAIPMLEMPKYDGGPWDLDNLGILNNFEQFGHLDNLGILNNLNNVQNSMIEEMLDGSEVTEVKGHTVFKRNVNVLTEIFQKHPNIDEKFQVKHPEFQSFIMKSLAEVYQKIESKPEMLELEEIPSVKAKIQDLELNGLQLSWLKEMLTKATEMLKHKAEKKRLLEEIDNCKAKAKEARLKLAKLEEKL